MVRTASRASEIVILINVSKLCHCRSFFFGVCYITSSRQLLLVFAIPGTHRTMDVRIIPNTLFHVVVCDSVRIRDMVSLLANHPTIRAELRGGKIVVHKTSSKCSAMTINQCHEQYNGAVKVSDAQEPWQSLKGQDMLQHNPI